MICFVLEVVFGWKRGLSELQTLYFVPPTDRRSGQRATIVVAQAVDIAVLVSLIASHQEVGEVVSAI